MATPLKLSFTQEASTRLLRFENVNYFRPFKDRTLIELKDYERAEVQNTAHEIFENIRDDLSFRAFTAFDTVIYINLEQVSRYWAKKINTQFQFKDGSIVWVEEDFLTINHIMEEYKNNKLSA